MLPNDTQNDGHLGPAENKGSEGTLTVLGCGAYVFRSHFVNLPELTSALKVLSVSPYFPAYSLPCLIKTLRAQRMVPIHHPKSYLLVLPPALSRALPALRPQKESMRSSHT